MNIKALLSLLCLLVASFQGSIIIWRGIEDVNSIMVLGNNGEIIELDFLFGEHQVFCPLEANELVIITMGFSNSHRSRIFRCEESMLEPASADPIILLTPNTPYFTSLGEYDDSIVTL
jgi:hypothetical protein